MKGILVKLFDNFLYLSKIWSFIRVLMPASLHQVTQVLSQGIVDLRAKVRTKTISNFCDNFYKS